MKSADILWEPWVSQRLHQLARRTGRAPAVVLEQALADFEEKLGMESPNVLEEAELLEDLGRIVVEPRNQETIQVKIVPMTSTRAPRISDED